MMRPRGGNGARRRRGAAMAESSIVLSVFFLIVLGIIEMSQLGMTSQVVTNAVNAGCRVAVIANHSQADVTSAVSTLMSSAGIGSSSYTLTTTPTDVTTSHHGDSITVTVSVPFSKVSWLGTPMFLGSANVRSSATLSSERP